jgi:outer membrane lipoprotein-sorting protein
MLNSVISKVTVFALTVLTCAGVSAQEKGYDVFNPIAKYLAKGDADRLSAWFSDNLEVTIFTTSNDSSSSQARQIMKSFFKSYTPRSYEISHKAGRANMKYALGTLNAGGEMFLVTIFVNYHGDGYKIQQIKIERID